MFVFLSLCRLTQSKSKRYKSSIKDVGMMLGGVSTFVLNPQAKTFTRTPQFRQFLVRQGISYVDADKITKKMSYSSKMNSIIHNFKMYDTKPNSLSRDSLRTSLIVKAKKQGNSIDVTVSRITAKANVLATSIKTTWKQGLFRKKNIKQVFLKRPLTAQELEKINKAIDDEARPLIQKYSK